MMLDVGHVQAAEDVLGQALKLDLSDLREADDSERNHHHVGHQPRFEQDRTFQGMRCLRRFGLMTM